MSKPCNFKSSPQAIITVLSIFFLFTDTPERSKNILWKFWSYFLVGKRSLKRKIWCETKITNFRLINLLCSTDGDRLALWVCCLFYMLGRLLENLWLAESQQCVYDQLILCLLYLEYYSASLFYNFLFSRGQWKG